MSVNLSMEEALKLRLGTRLLPSLNKPLPPRGTKKGKSTGVCLSVKTGTGSVAVLETVLRSP